MRGTVKILLDGQEVREYEPSPERWFELVAESSKAKPVNGHKPKEHNGPKMTEPTIRKLKRLKALAVKKKEIGPVDAADHLGVTMSEAYRLLRKAALKGHIKHVRYGVYSA